jgi:hypothetical protein
MKHAGSALLTAVLYGLLTLTVQPFATPTLGVGSAAAPLTLSVHPQSRCPRRVPTIGGDGCPQGGVEPPIDLIVVHHCGASYVDCLTALRGDRGVSAHYLVAADGRVVRLVPDRHKAYHATYVNPRSIGIELARFGEGDYTDPMYEALAHLLARLTSVHDIPLVHPEAQASPTSCLRGLSGVIGHNQVQPAGAEACGYPSAYVKHDPTECEPAHQPHQCFQWEEVMRRANQLAGPPQRRG